MAGRSGDGRRKGPGGRNAGGGRAGGRAGGPAGGRAGGRAGRSGRSQPGPALTSGGQGRTGPPGNRGPGARKGSTGSGMPNHKGLGGRQVEGRQAVRELLMAGRRRPHEIWISSELEGDDGVEDIVELARVERVPVAYVAKARLEREARSEAPQGVLAFAPELREADLGELVRPSSGRPPFLVAVDGVTDPRNLGAILRSCEGAGVTGVLLPQHRSVHVTPTVTKTSAGAVEYVPIALVAGLPTTLKQLRSNDVWVVGLDDAAEQSLFELGDLATSPICVVLGAEGAGLSRLVRDRCDALVSIPMSGQLSSLNVSVAAALATYQVAQIRDRSR